MNAGKVAELVGASEDGGRRLAERDEISFRANLPPKKITFENVADVSFQRHNQRFSLLASDWLSRSSRCVFSPWQLF